MKSIEQILRFVSKYSTFLIASSIIGLVLSLLLMGFAISDSDDMARSIWAGRAEISIDTFLIVSLCKHMFPNEKITPQP